jgi:hypothetical protein
MATFTITASRRAGISHCEFDVANIDGEMQAYDVFGFSELGSGWQCASHSRAALRSLGADGNGNRSVDCVQHPSRSRDIEAARRRSARSDRPPGMGMRGICLSSEPHFADAHSHRDSFARSTADVCPHPGLAGTRFGILSCGNAHGEQGDRIKIFGL